MKEKQRIYYCIDMKSFFASVECAERGLNPFETNLVVADEERGSGALHLAITPKMKTYGLKSRGRLRDIPKNVDYIIAKPQMKKYIQYAADIYDIYLDYIDPRDIHVYSIDESFIDATDYLTCYNKTPQEFAKFLVNEIATRLSRLGISLKHNGENKKFNSYHFNLFCKYYGIKENSKLCYRHQLTNTYGYSIQTIDFIVEEIKKDPDNIIQNLKKSLSNKIS